MALAAAIHRPASLRPADREILTEFEAVLEKGRKRADPARLAHLATVAFSLAFPAAKRQNRLPNAVARGLLGREQLMAEEGGSISADDAAREIGLSKTALLNRYHRGKLVGWREERQNAVRFPVWEFHEHRVLAGLEQTLDALNEGDRLDDWGRLLFFLQKNLRLGGRRPLDFLRENDLDPVLLAARAYVE